MQKTDDLDHLLQFFPAADRDLFNQHIKKYDTLLKTLLAKKTSTNNTKRKTGILALNGASGAGQSYVLERVEKLLKEKAIELPRIHLLATRAPRPGESHKNPYIFVKKIADGFQDIHHPETLYKNDEIYYAYQSRPGASNAILLSDVKKAMQKKRYLETVIPTLLHIQTTQISGIPPWGDKLKIVYLATPSGAEWLYRLLNREADKLPEKDYQNTIKGRVHSSIADMEVAATHQVSTVLNKHGKGKEAAQEILSIWGYA